jgi:PIN domain nuclease of toxin-antitoxin system
MRYLLDTQALLWLSIDDPGLTRKVKTIFCDPDNEIFLSMASLWEMAIKISLRKLFLTQSLEDFTQNQIINNDIKFLKIEPSHIYSLGNLPFHHRDPFDRLIIAQAIEENLPIIGSDRIFDKYRIERVW